MVFGILLKVIKMILGGFAPGPKHESYEGFVTSFHAIIFPSLNSIFLSRICTAILYASCPRTGN